ncbi:MAG: 4-hydroxythreonine-4-phosphate dehydrogenase PdxA [Gammaproteobacteria bacterium]
MVPRIALTPGDPAGIGPDITLAIAHQLHPPVELVVIANAELLRQRAQQLQMPLTIKPFDPHQPAQLQSRGTLTVWDISLSANVIAGQPTMQAADYILECLQRAVDGCLHQQFAALVTGPINKALINQAGHAFTGHTEFLAQRSGIEKVVMMLASSQLRVALVTTHLPLAEVAQHITYDNVYRTLHIVHHSLCQQFDIAKPRIYVCGLNPHAGEQGHLGREEIEIITPAINSLFQQGLQIEGPYPADTVFTAPYLAQADAIVAMYHDQGLPVIKALNFGETVNITLGLPFIRTSVDHGTAYALAGTGQAKADSLMTAIRLACELV